MLRTVLQSLSTSLRLIYLAGLLTVISVMAVVLPNIPLAQWPLTISLLLLYTFLFGASLQLLIQGRDRYAHLYLLVQLGIVLLLIQRHPVLAFECSILFFPVVAQAPLLLPLLPGFAWVFLFFGISIWLVVEFLGMKEAMDSIISFGGYFGFGAFGATLRQSEQSRRRAETLLAELQTAHDQLQQYTTQAEQLAVAEERNRLAREMHDSLGHRLTVAVVQLEGARRLIPTEPDRAAGIVETMRAQLKEALVELRQTLSALRTQPAAAEETADLPTAVSQLIHTFHNATGLPVHLHMPEQWPALPPAYRKTLYRAVQESLTNVQRHAQASAAWVTLQLLDDQIELTTADDGIGYPTEQADGRFGLQGLQERAQQLQGALELGRSAQGGAQLRLTLPLPEVAHA